MKIKIYFQPAQNRDTVFLHSWTDYVFLDNEGQKLPDGKFLFEIDDSRIAKPSDLKFKYRFSAADKEWESDQWERRIPNDQSTEFYTYDYTARCTDINPQGNEVDEVVIYAISNNRYYDGSIYLWNPKDNQNICVHAATKNSETGVCSYPITLQSWMKNGFMFKLRKWGDFEPDKFNRVWTKGDGKAVWIKSGQIELHSKELEIVKFQVDLLHPIKQNNPILAVSDIFDNYYRELMPESVKRVDEDFQISRYGVSIYPKADYELYEKDLEKNILRRYINIPSGMVTYQTCLGNKEWFSELPAQRDITIQIIIHPNPNSKFSDTVRLNLGFGQYGEDIQQLKPFGQQVVQKTDDVWKTDIKVFSGLSHWVRLDTSNGVAESRIDGEISFYRMLKETANTKIHLTDGIGGFSKEGGPTFFDLDYGMRKELMAAAYCQEIADAGVFNEWEMPYGAIIKNDQVWFTLKAPYAHQAKVLIYENETNNQRNVKSYSMKLTDDLRYYWVNIPLSIAPPGTMYRFELNNNQEVIDPANRWVYESPDNDCGFTAKVGEGKSGPWSRIVDLNYLKSISRNDNWETMNWDYLMIYELHASRFTKRNKADTPFEEIIRELEKPDGYLNRLNITALELLPLNDFPKAGWGYNGCHQFPIEDSYGGPEGFAKLVSVAHKTGKAVMVDLVYNHLTNCPLEAIAKDIYVCGDTPWGSMVYYKHPATVEFFRQAVVHMWYTYKLDGIRLDATASIINGHIYDGGNNVVVPGKGGGWEFLNELFNALHKASNAIGARWPIVTCENAPMNRGLTNANQPHVADSQWDFDFHYRLIDAVEMKPDDCIEGLKSAMYDPFCFLEPFYENVNILETHDSKSGQSQWQKTIVSHAPNDTGYLMTKAASAVSILSMGIPFLFMGCEAGEHLPFEYGVDSVIRVDDYEKPGDNHKILTWYNQLMAFRKNPDNGFIGNDNQQIFTANKTVAFTRNNGKFFVISTFGTPDREQRLSWLGLPNGTYKEVGNSTWSEFNVKMEQPVDNGGYNAYLTRDSNINLPAIGAVILERHCC